jgi:hypothetical protein
MRHVWRTQSKSEPGTAPLKVAPAYSRSPARRKFEFPGPSLRNHDRDPTVLLSSAMPDTGALF